MLEKGLENGGIGRQNIISGPRKKRASSVGDIKPTRQSMHDNMHFTDHRKRGSIFWKCK
jgi:hypothetical protein